MRTGKKCKRAVTGFQGAARPDRATGPVQPDRGGDPRGHGGLRGHEVARVQHAARRPASLPLGPAGAHYMCAGGGDLLLLLAQVRLLAVWRMPVHACVCVSTQVGHSVCVCLCECFFVCVCVRECGGDLLLLLAQVRLLVCVCVCVCACPHRLVTVCLCA